RKKLLLALPFSYVAASRRLSREPLVRGRDAPATAAETAALPSNLRPELVSRPPDEHVFQCRFTDRYCLNLSRESLYYVSNKAMPILTFHANLVFQHLHVHMKAQSNSLSERLRVQRIQHNHIATDLLLQLGRRPQGYQLTLVQDG